MSEKNQRAAVTKRGRGERWLILIFVMLAHSVSIVPLSLSLSLIPSFLHEHVTQAEQ